MNSVHQTRPSATQTSGRMAEIICVIESDSNVGSQRDPLIESTGQSLTESMGKPLKCKCIYEDLCVILAEKATANSLH